MLLATLRWEGPSGRYGEVLADACPARPAPVVAEFEDGDDVFPITSTCGDPSFMVVKEAQVPANAPGLLLTLRRVGVEFEFNLAHVELNPQPRCQDCAVERALFLSGEVRGVIARQGAHWHIRPTDEPDIPEDDSL